jgi:hypothetical protein
MDESVGAQSSFRFSTQFNFSPYFGLQGEIGYIRGDSSIQLAFIPQGPGFQDFMARHDLPWELFSFFINAVIHPHEQDVGLKPYGLIGLGVCSMGGKEVQASGYSVKIHSDPETALKLGGGLVYYFPQSPLGLNINASIIVLNIQSTDSVYTGDGISYVPYGFNGTGLGGQDVILTVDAGLVFRF